MLILKGEGNTEALELDRGKMRPRKTPAAETAGNQKATYLRTEGMENRTWQVRKNEQGKATTENFRAE